SRQESECKDQEKQDNVNSTNTVNVVGTNRVNVVSENISNELPFDQNMPSLEDIVSPVATTRIHKDHPLDQVIGDLHLTTQTGNMLKNLEEHRKRAIGTKWVFRNKKGKSGNVIRNKARLVSHRHTQEEGIDYDEVFASVARIEAIRLFLAYASFKASVVYQRNVKSAFLYGKIIEEVYVCQPLGFEVLNFPDKVYKVKKALYGLHQAPRAWYKTLSTYLLDNGFHREKIDKTLFIRRHKGDILLVQVYMDDIIFGSTKKEFCIAFEKMMHEKFQISLWYPKDYPFDLVAYTDSDYARASLDRKSTIGGCQYIWCRLISWQCKKQTVVANSTTEAEYVAASSCCGQLWTTAKVKTINGEGQLHALVDGKKIFITESTMRRDLQLEDAKGVNCLPKAAIFEQFTLMGTMDFAIIYLATNQKFNFSKYIFESMVKNLDIVNKFFKYPRFVQVFLDKQMEGMSTHNRIYVPPSHTKNIFGNMRRVGKGFSGRETPLFPTMMVHAQEEMGEGSANLIDPHYTPTIIQPSTSQPQKNQKPRKTKRKDTELPQTSGPITNIADEAVNEKIDDSLMRAATITSSLKAEHDSGNINKSQSKATTNESSSQGTDSGGGPKCQDTMGDNTAQTRSERVSKFSSDSPLTGVNTPQSDKDSLKLKELMKLCTNLQNRVLDLENTKTTQALEIDSLKRRVKKLKNKQRSRTHKLKRLYKVGLTARVESSANELSLGEDASKQGRISDIDADEGITLVSTHDDAEMFDVDQDLHGEEVFVAKEDENVVEKEVDSAQV
nr:putative ribonuclease H-like domain-containing protein [Tanacetum cinerariifolium]